jgi:hypothetical protein
VANNGESGVTSVRVQQCVEYLSHSTRQAMIAEQEKRLGIRDERDVHIRLADPAFAMEVWKQASEPERQAIRLFVTTSARGFFRKREWDRLSAQNHRHLAVGLNRLRRLGLVLTVRKRWSEIGYLMPREVREHLTFCLLPEAKTPSLAPKTLPYYITAGRGLHLDLFAVLLFIRDNDVPLTQKGGVHRRVRQKMAALLSLNRSHVAGWKLPPLADEEPDGLPLAVVLDVALRLGLVRPQEKRLVLAEQRVLQWLDMTPEQSWEQLYELAAEQYLPHESWWDALALWMKRSPLEQWHSLDYMLQRLAEAGFVLPDEAKQWAVDEWLHLLLGFGWIQLGTAEDGALYWRWNSLPRLPREEGWFVDPAGIITIPPLVPLQAVWALSRFCPLAFDGELLRGELQAKPLQAFLAAGGTEQQAVETLRQSCTHPLPEAVSQLIHMWGKNARQIQLEPLFRVRTAHPGLLEELRQIEAFQPYLEMVISPTDFLVTPAQKESLLALFRAYGYEPQDGALMRVEREETDISDDGPTAGLFAVDRPWDGYAVENTFPDQWEGMPQAATLPKMWTQHFQSYHPQTLRDLLQRARELELEVQLRLMSGQTWEGIPRQLAVEMGYWHLVLEDRSGKRRCRLDEIDRVRILLPDYLY